jgi:hypothetical protein
VTGGQFRHPEEALQESAIRWLASHWSYQEIASDIQASGAAVDSVGLIEGRLHLIEVKTKLYASAIWYDPSRSGSIEAKISSSLRSLYGLAPDAGGLWQLWDRRSPPTFVVMAEAFPSASLDALATMMRARSAEWRFDYAIWQWSHAVEERVRGAAPPIRPRDYAKLAIPQQVGHQRRTPVRSPEQMQTLADQAGLGPLFALAVKEANRLGFRLKYGVETVTIYHPASHGQLWQSVMSISPTRRASPDSSLGLNIGYDAAALDGGGIAIPGQPAPKSGYMMSNRYVASPEEVAALIGLFGSLRGKKPT